MKKIRYLLPYIKPCAFAFCLAPLLIFGEAMAVLIQPNLMAKIVNEALPRGDRALILATGGRMLTFALMGLFCGVTSIILSAEASNRFGEALRGGLYLKIQSLSLADVETFPTGSLITRLTSDTMLLQQLVQALLRILMRSPLMLLGSIFMALSINRSLISILILLLPLLFLILLRVVKRASPLFALTQKKLDRLNTVVQENLSGIRLVKVFSAQSRERKRFDVANRSLYDASLLSGKAVVVLIPLLMLTLNLGIIAVIALGAFRVQAGRVGVGDIMAYTNYLANILQSLMILSFVLMSFSRADASLQRIVEVLAIEPDRRPAPAGETLTENLPAVTFENVFFSYSRSVQSNESASEVFALRDISFHLPPGGTLGIIGATGSGKSTLLSLIPRLYEVTRGRILLNGTDVKEATPRARIGLVLQESILFSGTVRENLLWGKADATDAELREAARLAAADEFIEALSEGYDTPLGQNAVNLSGGQKQRLSLARSLVGQPNLLLLDDCTSAVDFRTEAAIRKNLSNLKLTKIIVAQRVRSIAEADEILVLDKGNIIERGPHRTLWKQNGLYRALCDSQPGSIPQTQKEKP